MSLFNKLTIFSILILLTAAFVAVPVMAHAPGSTNDSDVPFPSHTHPVTEVVPAVAENLGQGIAAMAEVPIHGDHPTTTITLKPGQSNVRNNMVAVVANDSATDPVMENQFTLLVTFDVDVVNAGTQASIAEDNTDIAAGDLTSAEFIFSSVGGNQISTATTPTLTITRIVDAQSNVTKAGRRQFEVTVTIADLPSGTADANDEELTFRIKVSADGVFGLQKAVIGSDEVTPVNVPGGGNLPSEVLTLTLVKELPQESDTVDPTVTLMQPKSKDDGTLEISYEISDETGLDTLITASEVDVENGMVSSIDRENKNIIVTPDSATSKVTVTVMADAVTDAAGRTSDASNTVSYTPEGYVPTITISAADEKGANDAATGKIVFTIDFSEAVARFNVSHLVTENAPELRITDLKKVDVPDDVNDVVARYELTIDPVDDTKAVKITIRAGVLETTDDNPFDLATASHTLAKPSDTPGTLDSNASTDITIKKESFLVVVRDTTGVMGTLLKAYDPTIALAAWSDMPDLQNVFETGVPLTGAAHGGGALILKQSGTTVVNPGTVGISEIMWAIDESQLNNADERKADQWIELHNLNTTDVTVKLTWKTGAKDIAADTSINGNLDRPYLDVVTNVFHDRPGNAHWVLPGQNGNPVLGKNFVSAARKGTFSLTSKHDNKFNKRYTRSDKQENASNSPDGRHKDQWAASTVRYANRTDTITTNDGRSFNVAYEDHGTPGRVNTFSPERATIRDARTDVPASPIIINEVANRDDVNNQYEWIELRNVSDGEINLNNYNISILTGVDKDEPFIYLPNNNNAKIPAGGVLLLVDSDPFGDHDHPLAVGWKIGKNPEDQVPGLASLGINGTSKHGRYLHVQFGGHGDKFITGLPDDGNFILIVRKPDNHENKAEGGKGRAEFGKDDLDKITDIAGYVGGLAKDNYTNAVSKTNLWPLKQQGAPDDKNRLSANKVRHRQHVSTRDGRAGTGNTHNDRKAGQIAFGDVGYSGVGYKRQAANSAIHGGTPGYDNGAQKGKVLDLATDKLVISELMLSQGPENARTTLPQWIEIHNPSPHPVHLGGWRLIIENPRDPIRTINLGSGSVKTILSEQTILVISGSARDIGSDTLPSSTVFPETRVYNVYKHQRNEFDMDSRFDPILDEEAFRITLIDGTALDTSKADQQPDVAGGKHLRVSGKYYAISDVAGNLDGDPRTNDTPEDNGNEAFKKGMTEDGSRTSLIRIFDDGVARDGTGAVKPLGGTAGVGVARMNGVDSKYSWVHAADAGHRFVRHTWYGDETDWGTPNNRAGQVLPVSLSHFRPTLEDGKVVIRWTTESELDNAGFNILRSDTRNGEFAQVNDKLIQGKGTTGERSTYKWTDATAKPGAVYYYQIEDVSFAGERQTLRTTKLKGLISAKGKLTIQWGELKNLR